jgi:hypothetical protein
MPCAVCDLAVVKLLLGLGGADPSVRDDDGRTPLDAAKKLAVEEMLRVRGPDTACLDVRAGTVPTPSGASHGRTVVAQGPASCARSGRRARAHAHAHAAEPWGRMA